ncbi:hypothetical protein RQP46_003293 [Phenoliferia psychrophenolica]
MDTPRHSSCSVSVALKPSSLVSSLSPLPTLALPQIKTETAVLTPPSAEQQGSNLPSSPSFVARYRRPGYPDDEEESSLTGGPSVGGDTNTTTSDDGTRAGDDSSEDQWSEPDEIDARAISRVSVISAEAWKEAIEESRGMSTFGQTLFNTINVLIGVGLLAEPLAFADAGWVCGTLLLLFCALITNYTAKMLARIMSEDPTLLTYSDVLIKAYGPSARSIIHLLFVSELSALSIALVVLFSDSMASLFPSLSSTFFKLVSFFVILPTTFLPLRFLSLTSLVGIISSVVLVVVLVTDGTIKTHSPGSLWEPMQTDAGPRWSRFPLSFGLMMSGFSGHAVIPSLYRDMREPKHFNAMINAAYILAFTVSMLMGTLGYIMFGNDVSDEVTRDMRHTHGYPPFLNKLAVWMIAINPVVKYALASTPLISTIEHLTGLRPPAPSTPSVLSPHMLDGSAIASEDSSSSLLLPDSHLLLPPLPPAPTFGRFKSFVILAIRPLVMALVVLGAILIPNFGIVLSFLGSSSAFVICAIGPIGAYLILGRRKKEPRPPTSKGAPVWAGLGQRERALCWVLLAISIVMAAVGTVWTCLPIHSKHRR